ncbi:MAG: protein kinase [Deltaproteobacteria bacterium]|nr:protein kinase [Deltaproteobacteria bacterium]
MTSTSSNSNPSGAQQEFKAAFCPKCKTGYRLTAQNLGHRSICVKCGQNFHLLPESSAANTQWLDTTAALISLATRVWDRGLDLRVGQVVLGVYVVLDTLGKGGLGQVFKVRHQVWQKELALKLPYRNVLEAKYSQSLINEAETWVALGLHPHVVTCYYVRPLMNVPGIFMEYVSGGSVKDMMTSLGGAPPALSIGNELQRTAKILDLIIQAAWGLEYAHGRGVLHLDIKPQNLLMEEDSGRLLVTDFGLARAAKDTTNPSDSASLWPGDQKSGSETPASTPSSPVPLGQGGFGTPQYMSPEATERVQPVVSFDLWSLALTALELFLGQRPWEYGGAVGIALEHYVSTVKPMTMPPPRIMEFFKRALNSDPSKRFSTAAEMGNELIAVYKQLIGIEYPRSKPYTATDSADNLNNRAVSLLDLGRPSEADKLWRRALKEEPGHLWAFFNLALHRFHSKSISAEVFQARLDELVNLSSNQDVLELPLILAGAYLELGLLEEADNALAAFKGSALNHEARRLRENIERGRKNPQHLERTRLAFHRLSRISENASQYEPLELLSPLLAQAKDALSKNNHRKAVEILKQARHLPLQQRSAELDSLWRSLYGKTRRTNLNEVLQERSLQTTVQGEVADYQDDTLFLAGARFLRFVKNPQSDAPITVEVKLASPPAAVALGGPTISAALTVDGHLWLFNPLTGAAAGQAKAHADSGKAAAFRPDVKRLFTAGDSGELKMWDTSHGYLDKGTPLLVRKISDHPLQAMIFSPNGRILSLTDGYAEYRLSADKIAGPFRTIAMAPKEQSPKKITSLVADPFNRYLVSSSDAGLSFHPLFDNDWKVDLSGLDEAVNSIAISPDAKLWAVALSDGRLLIGWAPDEKKQTFLPIRRIESGGLHHLAFSKDNAFLMALGQNGISAHFLDWNLEPATSRVWDKKSELILQNFLARQQDPFFNETKNQAFLEALESAGLPCHEQATVKNRLSDGLERLSREY